MRASIAVFASGFAIFLVAGGCGTASHPEKQGVIITPDGQGLRVTIGGQLFTEYRYEGLSRPVLYPLLGPGQVPMTRHWPFDAIPGEEHDHPHHRSVWFAHGDINGHDLWSEVPNAGKTVHQKFLQVRSGKKQGLIQSSNLLVTADNQILGSDRRTLRFYRVPQGRMFDFEVAVYASHGDLVFGDTKEGTMAIRLAESMRVVRNKQPAEGHIVLSTGIRDQAAWGKRADWCDYYGPVEGKTLGIAIFDHPSNPRHPTWWHVRDYGLFAANPFGLHDFDKQQTKDAGKLTIPAGQSLTFRYRVYIHEGDEQQAGVAERYRQYAAGQAP